MFSALALVLSAATSQCAPHPQVRLVAAISRPLVVRRGPSYGATARVTLSVRSAGRAVRFSDPGMQAHAAGYYAIARRLAQSSDVRAVGATRVQARARLLRAAATIAHDANAEYARQIRIYNAVTDGGRTQSQGPASGFPGGPNAAVYCGR